MQKEQVLFMTDIPKGDKKEKLKNINFPAIAKFSMIPPKAFLLIYAPAG